MDLGSLIYGAGTMLVGVFGGILVRSYLPGYAAEKGKNLATKEDIAEITRKVEEVKAAFEVERQERGHQH